MPPKRKVAELTSQDDHLFYPKGVSRQSSHNKSVSGNSKNDPNTRKQLPCQKQNRPWFLYGMTIIQVGVLIYSMVFNWQQTGQIIEMTPTFNYLIGPSSGVKCNLILDLD